MRVQFNLLPSAQKKHLATQRVLRSIIESEIYIVTAMIVFALALLSIYIIVDSDARIVGMEQQRAQEDPAYREAMDIRQLFVATHKDVTTYAAMTTHHYRWARVVDLMNTNMASGISVEEISSQDNVVTMRATAQRREDVVALKDKFRAVAWQDKPCFTELSVPEADLAAPTDFVFTMTFRVETACLY